MSPITEQQLQKKIIKYLDARNIWNCKTITTNRRGVPDILACVEGFFLGVECKSPERPRSVSQLQQHQIQKIRESGGLAIVASSLTDVVLIVDDILKVANKLEENSQ